MFDHLTPLGALRKKLREKVGDEVLKKPNWLTAMDDTSILQAMPRPYLSTSRFTEKTAAPTLALGARSSAWGAKPKGDLVKRPATEAEPEPRKARREEEHK